MLGTPSRSQAGPPMVTFDIMVSDYCVRMYSASDPASSFARLSADPGHPLGGGAKRVTRGSIVRLGFGRCLAQNIEIATGDRIERRIGDQTCRGFDALLDRAQRVPIRLHHHLGRHER